MPRRLRKISLLREPQPRPKLAVAANSPTDGSPTKVCNVPANASLSSALVVDFAASTKAALFRDSALPDQTLRVGTGVLGGEKINSPPCQLGIKQVRVAGTCGVSSSNFGDEIVAMAWARSCASCCADDICPAAT
jgi:hypothetical protein